MRNILVLAFIVLGTILYARPIEIDTIVVNKNGIENLIIEQYDASQVGENMISYRVFLNLNETSGYQLLLGTSEYGDMFFKTSGTWYNTPKVGVIFGENAIALLHEKKHFPDLKFDTYFSSGACADDRIAVPYNENKMGYIQAKPNKTMVYPDFLNLEMFNQLNSTENFSSADACISYIPTEDRGVKGPSKSNMVLLGQFTTDGIFEFKVNLQIINYNTKKTSVTTDVRFRSEKSTTN